MELSENTEVAQAKVLRVSIVTVCYNSVDTIGDTIASVQNQTYPNIEHIIIDGASNDGTLDIINGALKFIDIVVSEEDEGIYDAMNKGLALATGDIVGILNSDDVLFDDHVISHIVREFDKQPSLDAVYGDVVYVQRYDLEKTVRVFDSSDFAVDRIKFGAMCPHPSFYMRTGVLARLGHYKTHYRSAADFELMARFFIKGFSATRIPSFLVKMRLGGISNTGLRWIVHQNFEIVKACRENGIGTNIFYIARKIPSKIFSYFKKL